MPPIPTPTRGLPRRALLLASAGAGLALVAGGAGAAPPHHAHRPATAADAREARRLVRAQLDAFAVDDAERAFAYATPAIRKAFGAPALFLEMVKTEYPVVYRPSSVSFLKAAWIGGSLTQAVERADDTGAVWLAVYSLELQKDRHWRIAGCEVFPSQGRMV